MFTIPVFQHIGYNEWDAYPNYRWQIWNKAPVPPPPIVGNNKALKLAGRFPIDLTVSKLNKNTMKNNMFVNP